MAVMTEAQYLQWIWDNNDFKLADSYPDAKTPAEQQAAVKKWMVNSAPGETPQQTARNIAKRQGKTIEGDTAAAPGTYQQMIDWYDAFVTRTGGTLPTREQWAQRLVQLTGITTAQALSMYDRGREFQGVTGTGKPTESEWMGWLNEFAPQTTLDRERLEEEKRRALAEEKRLAEQSQRDERLRWAQMLASQSGPRDYRKYWETQANLPPGVQGGNMDLMKLAQRTPAFGATTFDPSNSWETTYANYMRGINPDGSLRSGPVYTDQGPGRGGAPAGYQPPPGINLESNRQATSNWEAMRQAYGAQRGQPPQPTSTPWFGNENARAQASPAIAGGQFQINSVGIGGTPPGGVPGYTSPPPTTGRPPGYIGPPVEVPPPAPEPWFPTQPIQISRNQYQNMSPTMRQGFEGDWASAGADPSDQWSLMRKAWTSGSAATKTRWR